MCHTSGIVRKTDYNAKITEIESKIPSITGLFTNSALTAAENKILDVSNLVTQKLVKLKRQLLFIIMINILLSRISKVNSTKFCCKITTSKFNNKDRF